MYNTYGYGYAPHMVVGDIVSLLFWVLIIILIVVVIRRVMWGEHAGMRHHMMHNRRGAISILEERYAKGEINKQEFEEKKKDLMS